MQRWRGLDAVPAGWGRCVATIGVYDGVHRGHQHVLRHVVGRAEELRLPSVVITFDPHPAEVVRPGSHPAMLTTTAVKADLLDRLGVDAMWVLPFTVEFSRLSPQEFVHTVLVERLHAALVVVGSNFRFGHRAAGNPALLRRFGRQFGFQVEEAPLLASADATLSSTYVRACVDAGDVEAAARSLGRWHRVEGVVVRGHGRGREIGYPTANVEPLPYSAVPADGIYAAWLVRGERRRPAAVSIGTNPTFDGRHRALEAYVLDEQVDLYGEHVAVEFVARLRATERFGSVAELVAQIDKDVVEVRRILAADPQPPPLEPPPRPGAEGGGGATV